MAALLSLEAQYLNHHRARQSSPKTLTHYENTFILFRQFLSLQLIPHTEEALTGKVLAEFALWMQETPTRGWRGDTRRSIVTIHGHLKDMRAFCRWLNEEGLLDEVPRIHLPKLPQTLFPILEQDELVAIFRTRQLSIETEIGKRNRALLSFMLDTGVRLAEVASLKLEDVYLSEGVAKIWGKGSRERLVFFSQNTGEAIKLWLSVRGREDGSLFWLEAAGIRMLLDRIQKEADLPVFHAHQIRHTALTMMIRKKMNPHEVKRIAGHSNILVTERYLSLSSDDLKSAHTSASPVDQVLVLVEPEQPKRRRWSHRKAS